jgi:murein L,D-transpeptidase YafK
MIKKLIVTLLIILYSSFLFCINSQESTPQLSASDAAEEEIAASSMIRKEDVSEMELFFDPPANPPKEVSIKVFKRLRVLELYGDDKLLGRFKIALGKAPEGDKSVEGDGRTPVGKYYICTRNEGSKYILFLGLSYPNTEDAERGLRNGIITEEVYRSIEAAEAKGQRPPWNTPMGGQVGIHGGGNSHDWTEGCIALSDKDIILLGRYVTYNTPVHIFE